MDLRIVLFLCLLSCALLVSGQETPPPSPDVPVVSEKDAAVPTKEQNPESVVLEETPVEKSPEEGKNETKANLKNSEDPANTQAEYSDQNKKPQMLIIMPDDPHVYNPNAFNNVRFPNYPYQNAWNRQAYSIVQQYSAPTKPKPVPRFDPLGDFSDAQKRRQFYQDLLYNQLDNFKSKIEPLMESEANMTEKNDLEDLLGHVSEFRQHLHHHQLFNISQIMEDWKQGKIKEAFEESALVVEEHSKNATQTAKPDAEGKPVGETIRTVYIMAPNPYQTINRFNGYQPDNSHFHRQFAYNRPVIPIYRQQAPTNNNIPSGQAQTQAGEIYYGSAGRRYEMKPDLLYQ